MALHRFFLDDQVFSRESAETFPLRLNAEDGRHAAVLRLRPGEHIAVIDGTGDYFECELVEPGQTPIVRIAAHEAHALARYRMTLAIGLPKGSILDDVVRATTELGVDEIVPFVADRSVPRLDAKRTKARLDRWTAIARSAAMQAGRDRIPIVKPPLAIEALCEHAAALDGLVICWEEAPLSSSLRRGLDGLFDETMAATPTIGVVIGPEGGLTEDEVAALTEAQPHTVTISLGPHILRVATAAISAVCLLDYELSLRLGR